MPKKGLNNRKIECPNRAWAAGQAAARERARAALSAEAQADLDWQLWDAACKGDVAAIERLAAEGASPNAKSRHGTPAVVMAAHNGHAGAVSALLRLGADLDARNSNGWTGSTALMIAALKGKVECARALLAGGADRTLRAADGETALEIAERYGEAEVAALLANERPLLN